MWIRNGANLSEAKERSSLDTMEALRELDIRPLIRERFVGSLFQWIHESPRIMTLSKGKNGLVACLTGHGQICNSEMIDMDVE